MADTKAKRRDRQPVQPEPGTTPPATEQDERPAEEIPAEEEPGVERGERIDTGKRIARGGTAGEHVPGATEEAGEPGEEQE